jgi:hypothetical protein
MEENSTSVESVVMNRFTEPEVQVIPLLLGVLMREDTYNE